VSLGLRKNCKDATSLRGKRREEEVEADLRSDGSSSDDLEERVGFRADGKGDGSTGRKRGAKVRARQEGARQHFSRRKGREEGRTGRELRV